MDRFRNLIFLMTLALAAAPSARAAADFEALKAETLTTLWQSALKNPPAPPANPSAKPIGPREVRSQVLTYQRGGYTWQWDAQRDAEQAARNLRSAGIAVLATNILRESDSDGSYTFRIDYVDDQSQGFPPRSIESYTSGFYTWQSDAEQELNRAKSNLRASGYVVVLGRVLRQKESPGNYYFELDYVRGRYAPGGQVYIYTSPFYASAAQAQRDMYAAIQYLQAQGYYVYSAAVLQDARTRYYFYQIRYGGR